MSKSHRMIVNGWYLFVHPLFHDQFEALVKEVESLRKKLPLHFKEKNATKRLRAVMNLVFEQIPQNPASPEYRLGLTLGSEYKHWFRAKFFQQYRLFFRFHLESKIIVYAWINDHKTKRAYDSKSDAYYIFKKMLKNGCPPNDWETLLLQVKNEGRQLIKPTINEPSSEYKHR